MKEVLRTNDAVRLSYAMALLTEAGCHPFVADRFMSAVEGGIAAFQRRIMVPDEHLTQAKKTLLELDTLTAPPPDDDAEDM